MLLLLDKFLFFDFIIFHFVIYPLFFYNTAFAIVSSLCMQKLNNSRKNKNLKMTFNVDNMRFTRQTAEITKQCLQYICSMERKIEFKIAPFLWSN